MVEKTIDRHPRSCFDNVRGDMTRGGRSEMPRRCAFRCIVLLVMSAAAVTSLLLSTISRTEAQSFNCRYAKTPDEVLICRDFGLAQLDEQMASVFFSVRNSVSREEQTSLDAGQRSWLRARMSCGRDANCIAAVYRQRIAQLTSLQARLQQPTPGNSVAECQVLDPTGTPLNVRTSPDGNIVGALSNGLRVVILDHTSRRGKDWVYIGRANDRAPIGWVFESYLNCSNTGPVQASGDAEQVPPAGQSQAANSSAPTATSQESSGTGFFVAPHFVLTNNHVIKSCGEYPITVTYPDRRPVRAYIAGRDETNDLVLLETDLQSKSIASFRFGPRVGEQVAAFGYPLSGLLSTNGNFTLGNVTALAGMRDDTRVLQTSAPVQPGNSGGPLLDMSGNVVGVVEAQLDALTMIKVASDVPQNVNFAI